MQTTSRSCRGKKFHECIKSKKKLKGYFETQQPPDFLELIQKIRGFFAEDQVLTLSSAFLPAVETAEQPLLKYLAEQSLGPSVTWARAGAARAAAMRAAAARRTMRRMGCSLV